MPPPSNNLLLRLHKWAWRQDENFLTEAFAHLLQYLLENEPEAAVGLIKALTKGAIDIPAAEARLVALRTQALSAEGIPDLELRTTTHLAYFEVKGESATGTTQLSRYRKLLQESELPNRALVLLTRYPASLSPEEENAEAILARWYQVAECLMLESGHYVFKPISSFLVNQFLTFLGARNMSIGQVTWEFSGGIRALRSLTDMLYEAASSRDPRAQIIGTKRYMGVYLNKRAYWIGVYFDQQELLFFETYNQPVNKDSAETLGVGTVYEWSSGNGFGWKRELKLESEEVHFFARSKANQMQVLENYLRECLELVKKIELPISSSGPRIDGESDEE